MYNEIVEYFFMNDMKFRAVIVDKSQIDNTRPEYSYDDFYFKMYFQLLHNEIDLANNYNLYFDIKDTCSEQKLQKLKQILQYNASVRHCQFAHLGFGEPAQRKNSAGKLLLRQRPKHVGLIL